MTKLSAFSKGLFKYHKSKNHQSFKVPIVIEKPVQVVLKPPIRWYLDWWSLKTLVVVKKIGGIPKD
jgi:hypothetical protein